MDTLVFDIETKNFFTDPTVGKDNFAALMISAVCVYSYLKDTYVCFGEDELQEAAQLFRTSGRLVGFSMNRYDIPVLNLHFKKLPEGPWVDLWEKDRVDLLDDIEMATGRRISLSRLAEANLGVKKTRHGSEAITLYKEGRIKELKEYCLNDVRLTKDLYDIARMEGALMIPDGTTGEKIRVMLGSRYTTKPGLF